MLDFNQGMHRLVGDLIREVPEFGRFDPDRILVSSSFNRSRRRTGLLAYLLPLKYKGGSPVERRVRGRTAYHWARLPTFRQGREILYVIYFLLPRFLNLSFREKLETIVHELYHIHPDFNGDLRRFKGRSQIHGSLREYEAVVKRLTSRFLESSVSMEDFAFLKKNFWHASRLWDGIEAIHLPEPKPKLIRVSDVIRDPDAGV